MKLQGFAIPLLSASLFASTIHAAPTGQTPEEPKFGRYIGLAAGAVAGFAVGYSASDDDAVNAGQKLARNVILGSVLGGVGGYFLGRAIDKRSFRRSPDPVVGRQIRNRLVDQETEKLKAFLDADLSERP